LYRDENGFSAVWGEVEVQTTELIRALDQKVSDGTSVTLRCGKLEIKGRLTESETNGDGRSYKVSLEEVHYA
jgi:hypothetical protein